MAGVESDLDEVSQRNVVEEERICWMDEENAGGLDSSSAGRNAWW